MPEDYLAERARDAGWSFMAIFYKSTEPDLKFTEYYRSITEFWDAKRFWRVKSRGRYYVKRIYDLSEA
jgi:hypothetical protein